MLEECEISILNERERYWIKCYNSYEEGYNLTPGGDGISLPEETINKIRILWENGETIVNIAKRLNLSHSTIYHRVCEYDDFDPIENKRRAIAPQEKSIV